MSQTPAGWYPDASGTIRWWDGTQWTEHTQTPPPAPTEALPLDDDRTVIRSNPQAAGGPSGGPTDSPSDGPTDGPSEKPSDTLGFGAPQTPPPGSSWGTPADQQGQPSAGYAGPSSYQPGYPPDSYAQQGYPQQQGYPSAYQQWPGAEPAKRRFQPWMIIVAGVVAVVVVVGLVLLFTLRGGTNTSSTDDFCNTLRGLPSNTSLSDATSAIKANGLPDGMPADAKHGFDLYVQFAGQLDNAASMSPAQLASLVGGASNLDDMRAFNTYIQTTCGTSAPSAG